MSSIHSVATVTAGTGTAAVTQTPFSFPMAFVNFSGGTQLKRYNSLTEVSADHATSSAPYLMAARLFGDTQFRPRTILIGRRSTEVAQVTVLTFAADFVTGNQFDATVNGTAITQAFSSDHDTTGTALAAQIQALGSISTAVWADTSPGGTITITGDLNDNVYGGGVTITDEAVTGGASQTTVVESVSTPLTNCVTDLATLATDLGESGNWYGFASDLRTDTRIRLMATWASSNYRLYVWQSDTAALYDADDSTDVGSLISAAALDWSVGLYYGDDSVYADCAWLGRQLAIDIDNKATIWRYARLQGVTYSTLTSAQEAALTAKNVNYYTQLQTNRGATQTGVTGAGNAVDQRVGLDWIRLRSVEALVAAITAATARGSKIPHTPSGYATLEGVALGVLRKAVRTGFLTDEPLVDADDPTLITERAPYIVIATPSAADRAARRISMSGYGWLAGAVETIQLYDITLEV